MSGGEKGIGSAPSIADDGTIYFGETQDISTPYIQMEHYDGKLVRDISENRAPR